MGKQFLLAVVFCTSGCATSAFKIPPWDYTQSTTTPVSVENYLASHVKVYDGLLDQVETAKGLLEVPIIPAAIVGTTAVALGGSANWPIALGGGAASLTAGSNYLSPRERLGLIVQARAATVCIRREYVQQLQLLQALNLLAPISTEQVAGRTEYTENGSPLMPGAQSRVAAIVTNEIELAASQGRQPLIPTSAADSLPLISDQISGVGSIAVAAADEVVTRLKSHLAAIGTVPDYGSIVSNLRQQFDKATAKADATTGGGARLNMFGSGGTAANEIVKQIAEYSARIDQCTTKIAP